MIKNLKYGLAGILLVVLGWLGIPQVSQILGISHLEGAVTLMGTSSNFVGAPKTYVEASATTTGTDTFDGGGNLIAQELNTSGIEDGLLCLSGVGGSATSTLFIKQMGSYDGLTFSNVGSSTDTFNGATSTAFGIDPKVISFDFLTSSSTNKCYGVNVKGYKFTRFETYGEDLAGENDDGVQAWIRFISLDKVTR